MAYHIRRTIAQAPHAPERLGAEVAALCNYITLVMISRSGCVNIPDTLNSQALGDGK
jgi:hypothetical protein